MSLEPQKERLAKLLRDYRTRSNLSSRAFAKRLGLNATSVLSYMDETVYPSPETRQKIARAIDMTPPELEAYLNDIQLAPQATVDQIKQDVRVLDRRDLLEVAEVVFECLLDAARATL